MAWFYLLVAGMLEIGWAIGMKYTNGFTRLWPTAATFATMTVSFYLLSLSLKTIPMARLTQCGPASARRARRCLAC